MSSVLQSESHLGTLEEVGGDCSNPGNAHYCIHTPAEVKSANNAGVDGQEEGTMIDAASRTSGDSQSTLNVVEVAGLEEVVY